MALFVISQACSVFVFPPQRQLLQGVIKPFFLYPQREMATAGNGNGNVQRARKIPPLGYERIALLWNLWTGLYMLEPWEKAIFSACSLEETPMEEATVPHRPRCSNAYPPSSSTPLPISHICFLSVLHLCPLPIPASSDSFLIIVLSSLVYYFLY